MSPGTRNVGVGCVVRNRRNHEGNCGGSRATGRVLGIDRDQGLIARARTHCRLLPNLGFEEADATDVLRKAKEGRGADRDVQKRSR